jgi:hypothetical protein
MFPILLGPLNRTNLNHWATHVVVEVEINLRPTVSWPVCLGAGIPSGSHDHISFIFLTIAGFLIWGTLSDERMSL